MSRLLTTLVIVVLFCAGAVACGSQDTTDSETTEASVDDSLVGAWVEPEPGEDFTAECILVEEKSDGTYRVAWNHGLYTTSEGDSIELGDDVLIFESAGEGTYTSNEYNYEYTFTVSGDSLATVVIDDEGEESTRDFERSDKATVDALLEEQEMLLAESGEPSLDDEDEYDEPTGVDSYPDLSKAEYKKKCRNIKYKVLERDADRLAGRLYHFKGEVFQAGDAGEGSYYSDFGEYGDLYPQTQILLAVTADEWGYYDDNVMILYDKGTNIYEEDMMEAWGECLGSYTYESTAGYTITVPLIWAKYVQKR